MIATPHLVIAVGPLTEMRIPGLEPRALEEVVGF